MQPLQPLQPYILNWEAQIKKDADESRRIGTLEREAQAINQLNKQRLLARRTKPLTEQIDDLMRSLPPALRSNHRSMSEIVSRLQGKYRDRPHPQHVGQALKQLGWRRIRLYGKGFDGVRLWLPPDIALPI